MIDPQAFDLVDPAPRPDLRPTGRFWLAYIAVLVALGVGYWLAASGHAAGAGLVQ